MIDWSLTDDQMSTENRLTTVMDESEDISTKPLKTDKRFVVLSENEIKSNSVIFLFAGYETTSLVLSYATHFLVNYPDIQERVRQEVIDLLESEGKLDYNTVSKLQYMECVLNETMRLHPPLINSTARMCLSDYKYKNITIPKGATVRIWPHFHKINRVLE